MYNLGYIAASLRPRKQITTTICRQKAAVHVVARLAHRHHYALRLAPSGLAFFVWDIAVLICLRGLMIVLLGSICFTAEAAESVPSQPTPVQDPQNPLSPGTTAVSPTGLEAALVGLDKPKPSGGKFDGRDFSTLPWQGSILFSDDELSGIYASIKDYVPSETGEPFQGLGEGTAGQEGGSTITVQAPAFFLSSVLYYTPESWSVWIGKDRIRSKDSAKEKEGFKIIRVTNDSVEGVWRTPYLDNIIPGWRQNLLPFDKVMGKNVFERGEGNWDYVSEDATILVDSKTGTVKFRLGLHQSFVSHRMEVVEGEAEGKTITIEREISKSAAGLVQGATGALEEKGGKLADKQETTVPSPVPTTSPPEVPATPQPKEAKEKR